MSNQVLNVWFIQGDADEMRELYKRSFSDGGELTFDGVVPVEKGERRAKWGCTSDARTLQRPYLRGLPGPSTLYFETAFYTKWSPPTVWLEQVMKQFPNTSFRFLYTDEVEFAGLFTFSKGEKGEHQFEPQTEEFYSFIKEFPVEVHLNCMECGENLTNKEYINSKFSLCTNCSADTEVWGVPNE